MPIERGKVAVILLGAQTFPNSRNYTSSEAFHNSYRRIKDFFANPQGLALQDKEDILDLFDSDQGPNVQDELIANFIRDRKAKHVEDVIIYYTGHGGFSPDNGGFLLTLKSTRDANPGVSSLTFKTLSITISAEAANLRTFFILDCCFAAEATLQSTQMDIIRKQVDNDFPSKGIAFLCASSKDLPAIIVKERNITMFTEGLEKALRAGSVMINSGYLTLREIHKLTFDYIKELNRAEFVRPEVHTTYQQEGDIADIRHFPNYAYLQKAFDFKDRRKKIMVELGNDQLWEASKSLQTYTFDFASDAMLLERAVSITRDCKICEDKVKVVKRDFDEKVIDRDRREQELNTLRVEGDRLCTKIMALLNDVINSNAGAL